MYGISSSSTVTDGTETGVVAMGKNGRGFWKNKTNAILDYYLRYREGTLAQVETFCNEKAKKGGARAYWGLNPPQTGGLLKKMRARGLLVKDKNKVWIRTEVFEELMKKVHLSEITIDDIRAIILRRRTYAERVSEEGRKLLVHHSI